MKSSVNPEGVITSGDVQWNYSPPPDRSASCFLLTTGGMAIRGKWGTGAGIRAWFPMPKRNKELEREMDKMSQDVTE